MCGDRLMVFADEPQNFGTQLFESHVGRLLFRWAYRCQHRRARQTKCFPACVRKNNLIGCPLHCEPAAIVKPRHLAPLNALRTFEAPARCRRLQAEAAQLVVTPAALSHQVKHPEAYLEVARVPPIRRAYCRLTECRTV